MSNSIQVNGTIFHVEHHILAQKINGIGGTDKDADLQPCDEVTPWDPSKIPITEHHVSPLALAVGVSVAFEGACVGRRG